MRGLVSVLGAGFAIGAAFAAGVHVGDARGEAIAAAWRRLPYPRFTPEGCPDARFLALSPDGQHRLDFVIRDRPLFAMPGGGSDVGGHVVLVQRDTDRVLGKSGYVPLLSGFSHASVRWTRECVDLSLPEEDGLRTVSWPLGPEHALRCGAP
jgi:hypothetical protein